MTSSEGNSRELRDLIARHWHGQLLAAEALRLNELLAGDAEAQSIFARYSIMQSLLELEGGFPGQEQPSDLASSEPEVPESLRSDTLAADPLPGEPPPKSPVLGFLGGVVDYVSHSRRMMFLLIAVMLSGWFVFQIGSVLLGRWFVAKDQVADRGDQHPGTAGPKPPGGGSAGGGDPANTAAIAWLSGSVNGRWQVVAGNPNAGNPAAGNPNAGNPAAGNPAEPEFWEIGTEFTAGQQVKLVAGLGEITFRSGAKVVISAPAQFSVTSALGTDLQLGKLTARVPHDSWQNGPSHPGATGFTVGTPAGRVVDLGTEFGVEVTPEHKVDVQVFVGEVQVDSPLGTAGPGDTGEPRVHVTAGKTVYLEPGKPASVVESKDKDRFQRDLTIASDSGDKQLAAYLDLMRQLKPVVWLRMEGKEGEKAIHDEMGNPDGKLHWDGAGNPFVNGAVGKSLWLRGPQLKDYAILPDYPKAEHDKLSVTAWVYADSRPSDATIAKNWGDDVKGQFHFGLYSAATGDSQDLAIQIAQHDGTIVDVREGPLHLFPLNEWQHVAFVADGSMLRLYRQGREVAAAAYAGLPYPVNLPSLGVGMKTNNAGDGPAVRRPGYWSGKLDEIAIFNDALKPEEIKRLATAPPR